MCCGSWGRNYLASLRQIQRADYSFQSLVAVGKERDVFFCEIETGCQVCSELFVQRPGVGKPAVFPDFLDEGCVLLKRGEGRFRDKDGEHFPCMYICAGRIWMLCE